MTCIQYQNVSEFLKENESQLLERESENNLILGLADAISNAKRPFDNTLFLSLTEGGQALRSNDDRPLAITQMSSESIKELITYLHSLNTKLSGVVGPKESALIFAQEWTKQLGIGKTTAMEQGVYELTKVIPPLKQVGKLHQVQVKDQTIALQMIKGFVEECFPEDKQPEKTAQKSWEIQILNKSLFFWKDENEQIVSMAGRSRESKNAACVSLVYTPPEKRGKGYASQVVAALSQQILDSGKSKCNLFTDLKNPTSNAIYQKIGYQWVSESRHINFVN
ncbi:MAG: hypothetical protein COW00_07145 [Bdellovibrio sp. CG12_big_fil_rev_8_21_14_0_65_39_13]|nr:MAG: hypothetical protein COW78_03270 [Bdellovibrio sp. CG22_combo_CG10-13_8_21_14_all_39_27]PIQ60375.1 MAG: hypothetical protein COW00_07145 [Bdellovibrio sp. CG12_big_fil_rev_8_21_14_0_65_39_13]PIR35016.1 MAG: hypothetical protein COV37_10315 [Bdellovibrio sp. CG11_big_fil_rev_8_21_14_0_20_39_38]PJB54286.1 MAG: hypothetical protein CO099_02400 [Bdellovibrio sp. CG_4_9_14_3_um_filter_39_7]